MSFDELIAGSPLPHILLDADGAFRACSETWLELVPDTPSNLEIVMAHTMGHEDMFARALKGETVVTPPFLICDGEGRPRWIRIEFGPASYRDGRVAHIVGHGRDVTEEEEARRELERSQVRLNAALGLGRMVVQDVNHADRTFVLYGDCPELREGLARFDNDLSHVHPDDRARIRLIADEGFATGADAVKSVEYRLNREPPTWVSVTYQGITGTDGQMESLLLINQNITDKVLARQELERVAFTDALTGLPNRARFQLEFEKAVLEAETQGRSVGLVMVDVDHFKDINDTLGHDAGDALLKALATEMRKAFRSTDIVARLGGDEFAILLQDISTQADLVRPLQVLSEALRKPLQFRGQGFRISTSVGAALHEDPDADASHLLKNADIALYHAKEQGRDRIVVFQPQMRSEVEQRLELLRDVRAAIPRGEFVLFYQPVVSLAENGVTGFEALMRWNHPDHGILPPSHFLAALEDQDLSLQLGDVTIETALKQMRAWIDQGLEFGRVSINLSPSQFRTGRLAEDLDRRLRHWGVPANRLTVEVTENVYIGWGTEIVSQTVRDLHSQGVSIALDDFGTGYASLANLRQFPIDRLKIDKSFVQNDEDDAIVRAVINLGASMGMEVVAEGVEKPEQLTTLSRYGCEQVQGFHFARPMPAVEVPGYLQSFKLDASPRSAA